jgi:YbbR domain-containing protein
MMEKRPSWDGKKILTKITENWHVKVLSIALALILFVFHRMSLLEDRFFSVPLHIETNENMVPASSYPRMVRLTVRGEANSIYPILEDDIVAYLDLNKYTTEGIYRTAVQIRKQGTALGVEPLEISVDPLEVSVELDQKISKYVPLIPGFQGYPEPGYEMVSYTLTPAQVVVDGPQRIMNGLSELATDFIELGGRSDDFTAVVRIMNRDPLLVIRGDGTTEFRGLIRHLIMIRSFENLPIRLRGLREDLIPSVTPGTASVRIEGSQSDIESYEPGADILYLDCSQITEPGLYTLPVHAAIPGSFTLIRSEPSFVPVRVDSLNDDEDEDENEAEDE